VGLALPIFTHDGSPLPKGPSSRRTVYHDPDDDGTAEPK
jgi:hypothetical protein